MTTKKTGPRWAEQWGHSLPRNGKRPVFFYRLCSSLGLNAVTYCHLPIVATSPTLSFLAIKQIVGFKSANSINLGVAPTRPI